MDPTGTIVFSTVGRPHYGFDIFSVELDPSATFGSDHRLTDGISINFNAQFLDDDQNLVFVSKRTGSSRIYLTRPGLPSPASPARNHFLPYPPASSTTAPLSRTTGFTSSQPTNNPTSPSRAGPLSTPPGWTIWSLTGSPRTVRLITVPLFLSLGIS